MKEATRNLLVGLFVIASFAVLAVLMVWFGEAPSWLGGSEWTLRITGIGGLSGVEEGSAVNLNGVQIGRVSALEFVNPERPGQGVLVVTRIKQLYSVPRGAMAKVYGATLGLGMGHVEIVVDPRAPTEPLDRELAEIPGEMHSILGEIIKKETISTVETTIARIGNLAEAARPVAENLADLLEQRTLADLQQPGAAERGVVPNLATALERIDQLLANVNAVLGDENVQGDVKAAVRDLKDATEALRETVALWKEESQKVADNLNTAIDRTEQNLDDSFLSLKPALENLDDAAGSLAAMMRGIKQGEGTAGLLLRDERLYEAAVVSFERLNELIATLQRIAGKIEEDGYISVGKVTAVGTFTKDFPVGEAAAGKE